MSKAKEQFVQFVTDGVKNTIPGASVSWEQEQIVPRRTTVLCIEVKWSDRRFDFYQRFVDIEFDNGKYDVQAVLASIAVEWAKAVEKYDLQPAEDGA